MRKSSTEADTWKEGLVPQDFGKGGKKPFANWELGGGDRGITKSPVIPMGPGAPSDT